MGNTSFDQNSPRAPFPATEAVSSFSKFGDNSWQLDIPTAGRRPDQCIINWAVELDDGTLLTDNSHRVILESAKAFLWSLRARTLDGRKRCSASTMFSKSRTVFVIIRWLISNDIRRLEDIKPHHIEKIIQSLRARDATARKRKARPTIHNRTLTTYLVTIKDMYRYRKFLKDYLTFDPFPTETTYEAAGFTKADRDPIPSIPDPIAVHVLQEAIRWVESYSAAIFQARSIANDVYIRSYSSSAERKALEKAIRHSNIPTIPGCGRYAMRDISRLERNLYSACFIVIAGLVGMRVSEILSLQLDCIKRHQLGDTSQSQAYIRAILFKTSANTAGTMQTWIAPEPVVVAVAVLERLSEKLRQAAKCRDLFLVKYRRTSPPVGITTYRITVWMSNFIEVSPPPLHEGRRWEFSTHQFRKTFARFIARQDRAQLLGLAEHFKHASVAMTAKGYIGSDFDLRELVDAERRADTAVALDAMLSNGALGGKLGDRIRSGNYAFRGRAGDQVRRDYLEFVLRETDLQVHSCEYGWCVFQAETSRCDGDVSPNPINRSPAVCLSCSNFVVEERHRAYWADRRDRNMALMEGAPRLTQAVLTEVVAQCDTVLSSLNRTTAELENG